MTMMDRQKGSPQDIAVVSSNPPVTAADVQSAPAAGYTPSYAPVVDLGNGASYTDYMANLSPSLKNERRALLATMAEYGMDGHMHWQRQQEAIEQARAASLEKTAARGAAVNAPRALGTELISDYDTMNKYLMDYSNQGAVSHGREMDRISAANAAYMDQIAAAGGIQADQFRRMAAFQAAQRAAARSGGGGGRGGGGGGGPRLDPALAGDPAAATLLNIAGDVSALGNDFGSPYELQKALDARLNSGDLDQATYDYLTGVMADYAARGESPIFSDIAPHTELSSLEGGTRSTDGRSSTYAAAVTRSWQEAMALREADAALAAERAAGGMSEYEQRRQASHDRALVNRTTALWEDPDHTRTTTKSSSGGGGSSSFR